MQLLESRFDAHSTTSLTLPSAPSTLPSRRSDARPAIQENHLLLGDAISLRYPSDSIQCFT